MVSKKWFIAVTGLALMVGLVIGLTVGNSTAPMALAQPPVPGQPGGPGFWFSSGWTTAGWTGFGSSARWTSSRIW